MYGVPSWEYGPSAAGPLTSTTGHAYLLYGTTDWNSNVPTSWSDDLIHWSPIRDALPQLPVWAAPSISMTWAPAVTRTSAGWVMYYSTEEQSSGVECIGRAVSANPAGPFVDSTSAPMLCQQDRGGSIDPSVVHGADGTLSLVWKNDGNSDHHTVALWSASVSADGLALVGPDHRLVVDDQPWELGVIEAPAMIAASAGGYWLFYSGGHWEQPDGYATGLAYCTTVAGPCTESSSKPFLASSRAVLSPGGLDTFTDAGGRPWVAFTSLVPVTSTRHPGHVYYNRVLDIAPLVSH